MEIKAQITKKLQKYKADEIKTLYQLMLRVLSGNAMASVLPREMTA